MLPKHYLLLAPEPDTAGTGPTPLERGDILEAEVDIDPEDPDAELAAAELTSKIEAEKTEKAEAESKKDSRIPAARHKEILEKEREKRADLERQLAQYQQGDQLKDMNADLTAAENKVTELLAKHMALTMDGEAEKATAVMQEIRKIDRDMAEAKSDMKIHAAEVRATERARYNTAIERVELAYPELNPDHEDYNEGSAAEVLDLMEAYKSRGLTPTAALQKAVKTIIDPRNTRQENAVNSTPRVSDKDVAAERKAAAVGKTAKATSSSPPSLANAGKDHDAEGGQYDAKRVMGMSQAEFAKLDAATLSKMRGDVL